MDNDNKPPLLSWVLLVFYGIINTYTVYTLAYSWPNTGNFLWFALLFCCPPFLYHLSLICYNLAQKKDYPWKKSLRFATLILGYLLASSLLHYTQNSSLRKFTRAYAPLVNRINDKMPAPCDEQYFQISKVRAYNHKISRKISKQGRPIGKMLYNKQRFIVHFLGNSVDVEGSTIFYDSKTQTWQLFHNNDFEMSDNFNNLKSNLVTCKTFLNET